MDMKNRLKKAILVSFGDHLILILFYFDFYLIQAMILIRILFHLLGVKYECLLCGNLSPSMNRYIKHYHSCHTEYGANRQCHTCSQYFFSRRNLMRHVRGERCPGRAVIYCYVTGRLFYRGRNPFSSRRGELVTRKSYNENALVAACSELACVQTVPQGKERVTYALRDLPLPNEHGIQPMCVPRDFCPRSPIWPSNVMPPLMTPREPRARDELESMLENAAAVPDQNVEAIALHVMENVDRAEAAAAAELNMPMQNNVAAIEPQPVIDANEIVVILDSNDESENVVNEVPPIGLASSESNKGT